MKVILKKRMLDQFLDAINDAKARGREIDRIEITHDEAKELRKEMNMRDPMMFGIRAGYFGVVCGIKTYIVEKEDY